MAKDIEKLISSILKELGGEIKEINSKLESIVGSHDIFVEVGESEPILLTEKVYLEMCEEIGEDAFNFMGLS